MYRFYNEILFTASIPLYFTLAGIFLLDVPQKTTHTDGKLIVGHHEVRIIKV